MNNTSAYKGLNFNARPRRIPPRALAVAIGFVVYTILWWIIPQSAFYWLLLPVVLILIWMSSYGWRQAMASLIQFLRFLLDQ